MKHGASGWRKDGGLGGWRFQGLASGAISRGKRREQRPEGAETQKVFWLRTHPLGMFRAHLLTAPSFEQIAHISVGHLEWSSHSLASPCCPTVLMTVPEKPCEFVLVQTQPFRV